MDSSQLPIHALREAFDRTGPQARLVLSSPTGSGKSTEVPRWCAGRVLVVEPRRVACRTLAQRMADLEGTPLGTTVGYRVRDDACATATTRVLLATPGIVLRMADELAGYQTVVLDEFHERSLEMDLLLALMLKRFTGRLLVMSATLQDERVATHLGGTVLRAQGRTFPVTVRHLPGRAVLPDEDGLSARVMDAVDAAKGDAGDILVFLPGKAEIAECARALERATQFDVMPLHGDLGMDQQRRVFGPTARRKIILATNVAETSVTVPGVGVVVDSGLVRQTRYHAGRGHLALVPVAMDSADQRAGRAGRTGPGVVYRLWSPAARLAPLTLPEIFRESLVPLVQGAAAWGETVEALPLLDRPKDAALADARSQLVTLGALDPVTHLSTPGGVELYGLPLDPWLGTLLARAHVKGCLADAVDLAAALSVGRPLFLPQHKTAADAEDPLRAEGCDATALILAVRQGQPGTHPLNGHVLEEARRVSARLRRARGLPTRTPAEPVQRYRLAQAAMATDAHAAHVPRRRGGHTVWTAGGAELELARESAVRRLENVEALLVLDTRAVSQGHGENSVLVTCAMPVPLQWLAEAGLGTDRLVAMSASGGRILATLERVYAHKTLATREEIPQGQLARDALVGLFVRGSVFKGVAALSRERLGLAALWSRLVASGVQVEVYTHAEPPAHTPTLEQWVAERVERLGVQGGEDLGLLSAADLTAPDVPDEVRAQLEKQFPASVRAGDMVFHAEYDPAAFQALLRPVQGGRRDLPPARLFPKLGGFRIVVEMAGEQRVVRPRS